MDPDREGLRIAKFYGKPEEDFQLWAIRVMAVLEGKELAGVVRGSEPGPEVNASSEGDPSADVSAYVAKCRKARAIVVTALGDKPLRAIQSAASPAEMWKKLHERYAASTTANKIAVLTNLMNKRYHSGKDMGEHLSEMESMMNRLAAMQAPVDSSMQVAILLVSVMAEESLQSTVAAIKTVDSDKAT